MTAGRLTSAQIVLHGLDVLEVVLVTSDNDEGQANAQSMLAGLDEESLRRVAGWLSALVVRSMQGKARDAEGIRRILDHLRLEATAKLPEREADGL